MRTIGIRAAPKAVVIAIYDTDEKSVINIESIRIPVAFSTPDALKYLRNNLLDVLREYNIEKGGIRVTESSAQSPSHERIQIEGVIQETFASSPLKAYYVGQISNISAKLGMDRRNFKKYVDGLLAWDVENWEALDKNEREAILCAMGAVNV